MNHKTIFFVLSIFVVGKCISQDTLLVNFKFDSSVLSPLEKDKISAFCTEHSNAQLLFQGFTDTIGSIPYNLKLAERRIGSVKSFVGNRLILSESPMGETNQFHLIGRNRAVKVIALSPVSIEVEQPMSSGVINGNKEVLDTIRLKLEFWGGTPDFKEYSIPELFTLYDKIVEAKEINVEIHGHVCCDDDMGLSIRRAQRVYDFLVAKGIEANRLSYEGHSNYQPRVPEISEANMQMNRRVEIVLYRKLN